MTPGILLLALSVAQDLPLVTVDRDDTAITESCRVVVQGAIADTNGDGVVHITGEDVVVDFEGHELRGATTPLDPDAYTGVGIRVTGRGATVKNARVSGFKCGIRVSGADDVSLEDCDVSDNFRQRLKSTTRAEDDADWLWPHKNDANEWLDLYGAGIWAEDLSNVKVRRCRARNGQNGLVLDTVVDSEVYDCDFSFLSGWGIALWRSSDNTVTRNACDFCVRGYSHKRYNRGQDSAGILVFEQCNGNTFAENSATHCGDGFFGFAGKEALGETPAPTEDFSYERRGCNKNILWGNEFSYAAAHGIELTFSFDNLISRNRLIKNAICGVWGGYSRDTRIMSNTIEGNGDTGVGLERGGINIEHAQGIEITANTFTGNNCGVHLWWDEDAHFSELPWMLANGMECKDNKLSYNTFNGDDLALHLRECTNTASIANTMNDVGKEVDRTGGSMAPETGMMPAMAMTSAPWINGETKPVGARAELAGRDKILMTEWGPYDWESPFLKENDNPLLTQHPSPSPRAHYHILGGAEIDRVEGVGDVRVEKLADLAGRSNNVVVTALDPARVTPFEVVAHTNKGTARASGLIIPWSWAVTSFAYTIDPREDVAGWREEGKSGHGFVVNDLALAFGMNGPDDLSRSILDEVELPSDSFGTLAATRVKIPKGRWRIRTTSDDGIRVWVDDELLIDDWTWHAPKRIDAEFVVKEEREVAFRVEHFELDGYAVLELDLEAVTD